MQRYSHICRGAIRRHAFHHNLVQRQPHFIRGRSIHVQDTPLNRAIIAKTKHRFGNHMRARSRNDHADQDQAKRQRHRAHFWRDTPSDGGKAKKRDQDHDVMLRVWFKPQQEIQANSNRQQDRRPMKQMPALPCKNLLQPISPQLGQIQSFGQPINPLLVNSPFF